MYEVTLGTKAAKQFLKLDQQTQRRIDPAIQALATEPRPHGAEFVKVAIKGGGYRIRVGDYRILYRVDDEGQAVAVDSIDHRGRAYRQRR